ncbi:uncharacterized protein LOC143190760 [Rhynchophorus ferrugineus]|uniref:C3H1-type domain-containing protein n=1 Tax=Rhynchophorus ferrugineus TaxID=354439 RepID=A0A834MLZ7_RHYFE|nr:hypothetical protein GWI33_000095 [Rhynchophorus ferrugineus]
MSLVADYSSDTSDTDSDDQDIIKTEVKSEPSDFKTTLPNIKLPVPDFDKTKRSNVEIKTSVFTNPFLEDENAKEAMLQKHVKMVNTKDVVVINGKKICWNYRKGRCRFGHNCKYAHDSDIQKTSEQLEAEKETSIAQSVICQKSATGQNYTLPQPSQQEIDKINEDCEEKKKRKRPGLTQGLVPGKKVMKQYLNQKS